VLAAGVTWTTPSFRLIEQWKAVALPMRFARLVADAQAVRAVAAQAKISPVKRLPPVTAMSWAIGYSALRAEVINVVVCSGVF
jgi:hypothetical protein